MKTSITAPDLAQSAFMEFYRSDPLAVAWVFERAALDCAENSRLGKRGAVSLLRTAISIVESVGGLQSPDLVPLLFVLSEYVRTDEKVALLQRAHDIRLCAAVGWPSYPEVSSRYSAALMRCRRHAEAFDVSRAALRWCEKNNYREWRTEGLDAECLKAGKKAGADLAEVKSLIRRLAFRNEQPVEAPTLLPSAIVETYDGVAADHPDCTIAVLPRKGRTDLYFIRESAKYSTRAGLGGRPIRGQYGPTGEEIHAHSLCDPDLVEALHGLLAASGRKLLLANSKRDVIAVSRVG